MQTVGSWCNGFTKCREEITRGLSFPSGTTRGSRSPAPPYSSLGPVSLHSISQRSGKTAGGAFYQREVPSKGTQGNQNSLFTGQHCPSSWMKITKFSHQSKTCQMILKHKKADNTVLKNRDLKMRYWLERHFVITANGTGSAVKPVSPESWPQHALPGRGEQGSTSEHLFPSLQSGDTHSIASQTCSKDYMG